ncbi:MAG: molybdopterin molybdenumtransferase MoeA [Actinobacteria bacterium]|nr:molybdopterin molybdenumtransferase MoeA [Actinomycetota bacterium]NDA97268.1 molybdopterin molybdenumtransferase MoeA [Actinomycetota bacterium]
MISLVEAQKIVIGGCEPVVPVLVDCQAMSGRVVAQDVVATEFIPPFANTAVDGFAVRAQDVTTAGVELEVLGVIGAGHVANYEIGAGQAARIMTGAPMPRGADAVVMIEDATELGATRVRCDKPAKLGDAIREIGEDVRAGDVVFKTGEVINAAGIGVLAAINARKVLSYPKLRVAMLSTGDELVIDGSELKPGQIRESNLTMLSAMISATGCEVINLGIVADDEAILESKLREVSAHCDAIVTSGGVGQGDFDVVKIVLSRIADMKWMQMAIKPAKPFAFGKLTTSDSRVIPIFGLPGNPVSSMISFELLARPALRKMMGHTQNLTRPAVRAIVDAPMKRKQDGKIHFMRVFGAFGDDGRLHVRDTGPQGSHQLAATAQANGLAMVPDGKGLSVGAEVDVMLLS